MVRYYKKEDRRFTVRFSPRIFEKMQDSLHLSNARSRNDYIKDAIRFYTMYLLLNGEADTFSKILGDIVETKIRDAALKAEVQRIKDIERLARNQFKIAVELAKIDLILEDNLTIPEERITDWHVQAVEEVRMIDGVL